MENHPLEMSFLMLDRKYSIQSEISQDVIVTKNINSQNYFLCKLIKAE